MSHFLEPTPNLIILYGLSVWASRVKVFVGYFSQASETTCQISVPVLSIDRLHPLFYWGGVAPEPLPLCLVHSQTLPLIGIHSIQHFIPLMEWLPSTTLIGSLSIIYKGFPYKNEEEIEKDLTQLLQPLLTSESTLSLSTNDQLILMTHNGPRNSCKC